LSLTFNESNQYTHIINSQDYFNGYLYERFIQFMDGPVIIEDRDYDKRAIEILKSINKQDVIKIESITDTSSIQSTYVQNSPNYISTSTANIKSDLDTKDSVSISTSDMSSTDIVMDFKIDSPLIIDILTSTMSTSDSSNMNSNVDLMETVINCHQSTIHESSLIKSSLLHYSKIYPKSNISTNKILSFRELFTYSKSITYSKSNIQLTSYLTKNHYNICVCVKYLLLIMIKTKPTVKIKDASLIYSSLYICLFICTYTLYICIFH